MLKAGQSLLLQNRRWFLRAIRPLSGRNLSLEAIGASEASQGMSRRMTAIQYDHHLFLARGRGRGYWYGHLQEDWLADDANPILACQPATWLDLLAVHTRHPAVGDLQNEFSWSYSRAAKYRTCPRAYYYHYYAAWEGWRKDAPPPVRRAYLLKNLTDLDHWPGTLVHDAIKFALNRLQSGQAVVPAELVKQMRARAEADFEASRSGRYRQQPNRLTGFQEHYYQVSIPKRVWQAAWTRAEDTLQTFLHASLYAHLSRQSPASFLEIEELSAFTLAGTKIWVQLDLARREEETIYLYDWKTAPPNEADLRQQLGIYGLYLRQAWPKVAASPTPIRAIVYNLAQDRLLEFDLDEALLAETQALIEASIARLRGLLLDSQANLAELRRFPMIEDLSVCRQCQFRELCGREKV